MWDNFIDVDELQLTLQLDLLYDIENDELLEPINLN